LLQVIQDFKSGKIRLVDVPSPTVTPGMVLVKTHRSAISVGTERSTADVARKSLLGKAMARPDQVKKVWENVQREGLGTTIKKVKSKLEDWKAMGYSSTGTVLSVGMGVDDILPGLRVACGGADYAVHADITLVPQNLCVPIHDNVSFDDAAFTTISAIALQGIRQADVRMGENVVVMGMGLLGLITVELLKASGVNVLGMDIRQSGLEWAKKTGVDQTFLLGHGDAEAVVAAWSRGRGADSVILTVATQSADPMKLAPHLLRDRGRIVLVGVTGLELEREPFYHGEHELHFSRSYGPGRYDPDYEEKGIDYPIGFVRWTERRNMEAIVDLISQDRFHPSRLITHRYPITEAEKAYDAILEGTGSPVGVLLEYEPEVKSVPPVSMPARLPVKKLGIGLIGAGSFAKSFILPEIIKSSDAEIRAIATAHGHTAQMIAEKYHIPNLSTDAQKVLDDDSVHMVFILTRHDLHAPLVMEALRRGKMVYVEKPLVLTSEELDELEALLPQVKSPWIMVGFNRVFSAHANFMREQFKESPQFMLYRVNAGSLPKEHWLKDPQVGGGRWVGEGCHFLNFAFHWMGSDILGASVSGYPLPGEKPDENLTLKLDFGSKGTFTLLYTSQGARQYPKEHLEIWGGGKTGIMEDFRLSTVHPGKKTFKTSSQDKGQAEEVKRTLEAALSGAPSPLSLKELLTTHRWLFKIEKMLRNEN
jgi:predicted dehydrogenase/threonine dehydrogenase-like Zn-dependent dehydrogenase